VITVHANDDWEGPYTYSLYSLEGRPVRFINSENSSLVLDVADLPRGTYVVTLSSKNNRQAKKVVLQ